MISTATFYGGAKDIGTGSSSYSITDLSTRVHRASWTSGTPTITLPPLGEGIAATIPQGGPALYIVNDGSVAVTLNYTFTVGGASSQANVSLAASKTAIVLVRNRGLAYLIPIVDNA